MDWDAHIVAIAGALRDLEKSLERLVDVLAHRSLFIVVEKVPEAQLALARRLACAAYATIDYDTDAPANQSPVCCGVLGVGADILRRAEAVNRAKARFRSVAQPLSRMRLRVPVKGEDGPTKALSALRVILRRIQRADLNVLAAYRKIPILTGPPSSVTYTRALTRSVHRKTLEDVMQLLAHKDSPAASRDRARLTNLDPRRDRYLAWVEAPQVNLRANVVYASLDPRGRGRVQVAAELPLMYPIGRAKTPPVVRFAVPASSQEDPALGAPRRLRATSLEAEPFLESTRVYRYRR